MAISDAELRRIYAETKTIAVVGASHKEDRAAHRIPLYLQGQGYRILAVNPRGGELFGERVVASIRDVDVPVDVVDVFRRASQTPEVARDAVAIGAKVLWLQEGIVNEEAAEIARAGGLTVVMDLCMGATHRRLGLDRAGG
jgi:predicted CoA-binding protein